VGSTLDEQAASHDNVPMTLIQQSISIHRALKERVDEDTNYEHITSYLKKQYSSVFDLKFLRKIVCDSCGILEGLQENVGPLQRNVRVQEWAGCYSS
jgi:hypothetical protein